MANLTHFYQTFQPAHYTVALNIDRGAKTIAGTTTIQGHASQAQIAVHQKYLHIASVTAAGQAVAFDVDDQAEAIRISLPKAGEVTLQIEYTAPLTDSMMGIYPSYYQVDGQRKELIGTQFETTAARQAFPCVDEPEAKATFSLAIKYDEQPGETIIANMPEDHVAAGVHYFQETVKMSTYLVAFAFGELQSKQTTTASGVQIGVFATKAHRPESLDFALEIAKQSIEFYEDFYQTPYPLPHSWQLALPDFSAGAMENWGLVTYREAYLIVDPANTSLDTKQRVATVIAHELAHQWFGDLVTMKWWDDLWLNESFANMMEYVAVDALHPEWHIWEVFQTDEAAAALQRDAIDGVQAVHVAVEDPAEIDSLFDGAIVYAKGARMLVMVRALIGDDALRQGLKAYFAAHQYGNATGDDLWAALGQAAGIDVGAIMRGWLTQPGYPVLTAKVVDGHLQVQQAQFFLGSGQDAKRQWQIPLQANFDAPQLLTTATIDLGDYAQLRQQAKAPLRLNVGNQTHALVQYDDTLLQDILAHRDSLNAIDQLQLLQDLRLLAESRRVRYADVVPLLTSFAATTSNIVNAALYRLANDLKKFVTPQTPQEAQLQAFYARLSDRNLHRLGWQPQADEANDDALSRPYVLNAALYAQNAQAIADAHRLFAQYRNRWENLPAAIRSLVLASEIRHHNTMAVFKQLLQAYQDTSDAGYKQDLCAALTGTRQPEQITMLIQGFKVAELIKPQDLRAWFRGVLANPAGQQAAWDWLRAEWPWLEATVGGDMEFTTYITVIAGIFHTPQRLAEFKAFFTPKLNTPGLTREITMDTKVITSRVDLIEAEQAAVTAAITAAAN
ncbi:M1 family metallopeptidase [Lacticaseibacillus baoqingensis]|uniref:Aminopeptidase n=1 Tax=Lacticaseibacillus baoqingensis TaxID=2486013 RepID=A0ABW4E4R7_9LACO|nr:M1 family metallopeptidase [Lacticaseibacillus baoqingensis]